MCRSISPADINRCSRCRTEYDFDDLLISERGTTVKCTNCGHQFRIFPASSVAPERWIVRTGRGDEVVYTSLRELQRAIGEGAVKPEDMVSRGQGPPRPLSLIAELERQSTAIASIESTRDPNATEDTPELAQAREKFNWAQRIFQERQSNIPMACELPVILEERLYALSRAIRGNMKS